MLIKSTLICCLQIHKSKYPKWTLCNNYLVRPLREYQQGALVESFSWRPTETCVPLPFKVSSLWRNVEITWVNVVCMLVSLWNIRTRCFSPLWSQTSSNSEWESVFSWPRFHGAACEPLSRHHVKDSPRRALHSLVVPGWIIHLRQTVTSRHSVTTAKGDVWIPALCDLCVTFLRDCFSV